MFLTFSISNRFLLELIFELMINLRILRYFGLVFGELKAVLIWTNTRQTSRMNLKYNLERLAQNLSKLT